MALGNSASIVNIKRSLDKYLYDNLVSIEGLNVDFEGLSFSNIQKDITWIVPRILDFDSTFYRQGSNTQYGENINILFQINIFTKQSSTTTSSEHYRVRDIILAYFKIGNDITIKNYVGDGLTTVDTMRIRSVEDILLPEREEFYQHAISIEMEYTRLTTES